MKNLKRNRKRFYITSVSMAISAILFITFVTFAKYGLNFTDKITEESKMSFKIWHEPILGETKDTYIDDNMVDEVKKLPNIKEVYSTYNPIKLKAVVDNSVIPDLVREQNYSFINDVKYNDKNYKYLSVFMNGFDKNKMESLKSYISSGSIDDLKENEIVVIKNEQMPGGIFSPVMNLKVGDEIKVDPNYFYKEEKLSLEDMEKGKTQGKVEENKRDSYNDNELITLKVAAIIDDAPYTLGIPGIQKVILPMENLKNILKNNSTAKEQLKITNLSIKVDENNVEKVEEELNNIMVNYPDFNVINVDTLNKNTRLATLQPIILLLGFVVVIALISSINIINTISTNINTRRKELAALKAIGMTSKELRSMICLEGAYFGIYGGVAGSILGTILSYLIYLRFSDIKNFAFSIPYLEIIIAIVGIVAIGYLSALIPMKKLSKSNIIEGIKEE